MRKKKLGKIRDNGILNINFTEKIILSSLSLVVCLSSLSFVTWAWFSDTATMTAIIQAADYKMIIEIKKTGIDTVISPKSSSLEYSLNPSEWYTVTLTPDGTATTGFCEITVDGKTYYTPIWTKDDKTTLTFTINSRTGGTINFNPKWGKHSQNDKIKNGDFIKIGYETQISEDITINILNQTPTIQESAGETLKPETDSTEESAGEELKPETESTEESAGEELTPETDSTEGTGETLKPETESTEEGTDETGTPETDSTEGTGETLKPEVDSTEESAGEELTPETDSIEESAGEIGILGTDTTEESEGETGTPEVENAEEVPQRIV